MTRRRRFRMPNSWETPASPAPTPMRLRRAVRSRLERMGDVPRPTGTPLPRYYDSLRQLKRTIRMHAGEDLPGLIAALRSHGTIYLRNPNRKEWDRLTADQVINDFGLRRDTLHHH